MSALMEISMAVTARKTRRKANAAVDDVADAAKSTIDQVTDAGTTVARRAGQAVKRGRAAAAAKVEDVSDALSDSGDRISNRLRRVAHAAEDQVEALPNRVSTGLTQAADRLRGGALGDAAADIKAVAQRNPGIFVAGAALAGFALARLFASRSDRDA